MSFWDALVSKPIVNAVSGVADVVDKFVETPDEKREWEAIKLRMLSERDKAQVELNKMNASERNLFIAGWRPFVGWVCAFGLAYASIISPTISWATTLVLGYTVDGPIIDTGVLLSLLMALLGLGSLRSYEKGIGVSK